MRNEPRQPFMDPSQQVPLKRGTYYADKRKRSYVSLIIQFIVLLLIIITLYSMYKESIFNIVLVNEPIHFTQILNFHQTLSDISNQNIDLTQINHLEDNIGKVKMAFYTFFIIGILSIIMTILTIIFNRTALKIFNMLLIVVMFFIPFIMTYIVNDMAKRISDTLKQYFITLSPDKIITVGDALNNAIILLACCFALLFISLFFRNRRIRIQ